MLHVIPLTVVENRKEVDDVKDLVAICKEYHIALRCELRRKELKVRGVGGVCVGGGGWSP
jgi:coatomer protein complex subunit alpha (xenin)